MCHGFRMTGRILLAAVAAAVLVPSSVRADEKAVPAVEQQIADATSSPRVTVVHFWAPWCSNCRAELANGGWSGFIAANPDVNFVFVTVWSPADGRDVLEKSGVGPQKNFRLLLYPDGPRKRGEKVAELLGIPISWIPTTWIFRDGELRFAMNYGELRFPMLEQLVKDSSENW
jgi:thiol-disulfide isomerase/thioredoxin